MTNNPSDLGNYVTADKEAFRHLGSAGVGWVELYKVYEVLSQEARPKSLSARTGVAEPRIDRFKLNANHPDLT